MTWSGRELLDCFEPYPGASLTVDGTVRIVTTAEAPRLACRAGALHPTGKYLIVEMAACGGESAELFLHGVWWERTGRRIGRQKMGRVNFRIVRGQLGGLLQIQ